jgi:hypothetical protein
MNSCRRAHRPHLIVLPSTAPGPFYLEGVESQHLSQVSRAARERMASDGDKRAVRRILGSVRVS